jgi:hypothetical protein
VVNQGVGQLALLIGHLKLNDDTGDLIQSFVTHLQLHIGSATPVFQLLLSQYIKWIDQPYWMVSICDFLGQTNASLEIENLWVPTISRRHDVMLMDLAIQLNFMCHQLCQINQCRLYLQVLSISDISTANGRSLLPGILQGTRDDQRTSKLQWPVSHHLANWSAWHLLLQHISTGGKLSQPLGEWVTVPHQPWYWFYDKDAALILHFDSNKDQWLSYSRHQSTIRT